MKIFHYTSIETLALILKHRTIRFNRLDHVDDIEESCYSSGESNIKLGKYQFVSCWTKENKENLSLWSMYTQYKGVRIGLDEDMFIAHKITPNFMSYIDGFFHISKDLDFIIAASNNEARLYDIKYVKDPKAEVSKLIHYNGNKFSINISDIGLYKKEEWAFQRESRFKITVLPICTNSLLSMKDATDFELLQTIMSSLSLSLESNYPIKTNFLDLPLDSSKLKDIEIMLGPQTTEAERIIVEALLKDFPQAKIIDSYFKGKIRKRNE